VATAAVVAAPATRAAASLRCRQPNWIPGRLMDRPSRERHPTTVAIAHRAV